MAGASGARRIVLNRAAFDEITLAVADGAFEIAKAVVNGAQVPDAAPYAEGLVQGGAALAYVGRKRVGIFSKTGTTKVNKPKAAKLSAAGITVIGGFGFQFGSFFGCRTSSLNHHARLASHPSPSGTGSCPVQLASPAGQERRMWKW